MTEETLFAATLEKATKAERDSFLEEACAGDSAAKPLGSIVVAAVIAAVVERAILDEHPLFRVPSYRLNSTIELVFYAALGLLAGLTAVLFNGSLLRLRKCREHRAQRQI